MDHPDHERGIALSWLPASSDGTSRTQIALGEHDVTSVPDITRMIARPILEGAGRRGAAPTKPAVNPEEI
jgi:hypothetical protein